MATHPSDMCVALAALDATVHLEGTGGRRTVTFTDLGAQTRLTLHQAAFETVERRDDHRGGWTSCFERFAEYMEKEIAA